MFAIGIIKKSPWRIWPSPNDRYGNLNEMTKLSWREIHLLDMLQDNPMKTAAIVLHADMAKATALKYLERLKALEYISSVTIGSTKVWWTTNFCSHCDEKMERHEIYVCPHCGKCRGIRNIEPKSLDYQLENSKKNGAENNLYWLQKE